MCCKGVYVLVTFLLLSLPGVQCGGSVTYTNTQICFLKGESVTLPCTYEYSWIGHYIRGEWYKDNSGRVKEHSNSNYPDCSLQINELKDEKAGVYHFRFYTTETLESWITGGSGIKVSVTDLTVKETGVEKQNQIEVTCSASCNLGSSHQYIWYKNEEQLPDQTAASILVSEKANYSCALPRYEALRSPAVCVPSHKCMTHTEYPDKKGSVGASVVLPAVITIVIILVVLLILGAVCFSKKNPENTSDNRTCNATVQAVHSDAHDDTYTALSPSSKSPEYDTLQNVRGVDDTYMPLQRTAQASVYETLQRRETPQTDMELQDLGMRRQRQI